MVYRLYNFKF